MKPELNIARRIFGKVAPDRALVAEDIPELLAIGRKRSVAASMVPTEKLLEILERVSRIWADEQHPLRVEAERVLPGLIRFSSAMVRAGLMVISHLCRPDSIKQRWQGELGGSAVLDGWIPKAQRGYDLRAIPHGLLLHIAAGNVFVGIVDSLLSGVLTKNANILKMSHADPVFPVLFMESLREADPEGLLWPNQALVQWKGGESSVEKPLLNAPLTVVFWGGAEALRSIRGQIGLQTRLIENGPRYSFAVADRESLSSPLAGEAIHGLALDISRWDQQACSSPHVVYIIDQDDHSSDRLMERLYSCLEKVAVDLPIGDLNFDEKVEIRRVRELGVFAELAGEGAVKAPEPFAFTLLRESDPSFKISCLNRTLFCKRVNTIDELMQQVEPIGAYLQTVGLLVHETLRSELESRLLGAGAKRLTAWGGMSMGHEGAPHEGFFMLSRLVDWVDREYPPVLETRPSPLQARIPPLKSLVGPLQVGEPSLEEPRLRRLLLALERSPYYSRLLENITGTLQERLDQLPLLDRETFYRISPPLSNDILTGPLTNANVYASGGTTGDPKFTFYANDEYRTATDVLALIYRAAGIDNRDVMGNLFLAGNLWTSFNVANRALENIGCLNMPIGGASDFGNIIKYLSLFQATGIVGLPSIIVKLAEEVRDRGISLRIPKVLYGGEHLRTPTVDFLKSILGCEWIRSAGYACVDTGPIGYQCEFLSGARHHVLTGYQKVEILDPGTGRSAPAGTPGEIISTNLDRRLMPVVRYRTGDLGTWVDLDDCPCNFRGRTFDLLGRCDDMLVVGGINLLPSDIAPGLARIPVSPNFQVVARLVGGKEQIILRLEAEQELSYEQVAAALRAGSYKLEEALRDGWLLLGIEWFRPGGLPRNARTGKLKTVIDERS